MLAETASYVVSVTNPSYLHLIFLGDPQHGSSLGGLRYDILMWELQAGNRMAQVRRYSFPALPSFCPDPVSFSSFSGHDFCLKACDPAGHNDARFCEHFRPHRVCLQRALLHRDLRFLRW